MNLLKAQIQASIAAEIANALGGEDDETIRDAILAGCCYEEIMQLALAELAERECMAEAIAIRQKELAERKARMVAGADKMREIMADLMNRANVRKVELPEGTLSLGNAQQSLRITDDTALPDKFMRIKKEPDKAAIKDALKNGETIAGAELSNGGQQLTIRRK